MFNVSNQTFTPINNPVSIIASLAFSPSTNVLYVAEGQKLHSWDGVTWLTLGQVDNTGISAMILVGPSSLWLGGSFSNASGVIVNNLVIWV